MAKCAGITQAGTACKGTPIDGSTYCYVHHPDHAEERRRHGSKGGKRGGRGRPVSELARLARRFEDLADKVLSGEVERGVGAVAGQLLNGARACVRDGLAAREQEELVARLEALEEALGSRNKGSSRWGGLKARIEALERLEEVSSAVGGAPIPRELENYFAALEGKDVPYDDDPELDAYFAGLEEYRRELERRHERE